MFFFVAHMRRRAKILILNWIGIIEKISYERSVYESVDDGSLSWAKYRKEVKKMLCI